MSRYYRSSYQNPNPYIPGSLGEIDDMLGSMILGAPTFVDESGTFPERNIESEFSTLVEGLAKVRKKLGEERYARLIDLATRAKALFADDPDDSNGKTNQGRDLVHAMEDLINESRMRRKAAKLTDSEGDVTGD